VEYITLPLFYWYISVVEYITLPLFYWHISVVECITLPLFYWHISVVEYITLPLFYWYISVVEYITLPLFYWHISGVEYITLSLFIGTLALWNVFVYEYRNIVFTKIADKQSVVCIPHFTKWFLVFVTIIYHMFELFYVQINLFKNRCLIRYCFLDS